MAERDDFTPSPLKGIDQVSRSLNEFYLELNPDNKEPYVAVKVHLIRPDTVPEINLYIKRGVSFRLFRSGDQEFSALELQAIIDSGIDRVYILRDDAPNMRDYLETFLTTPPHNQTIPMEAQVGLLRSHAVSLTAEIFRDPSPQSIRKGMKVVGNFVNVLIRDPSAFYYLINLSSHDPYTYQHSVGVGLNSIALIKKLGYSGESELMDAGVAGLLHDIGKTRVDPAIINKPGKLDEREWAEMSQHSKWSYDIVKDNPDINERIRLAMRHHHEDMDGNGYPDRLPGNQISLYAKVVSLADIFNALTTDRTYSKAKSPFEALRLMQEKMSHKFDPDFFRSLVLIYGGDLR